MILGRYEKPLTDQQSYEISYSPWLRDGETVSLLNSLVITPDDTLIIDETRISTDSTSVSFIVSGGSIGTRYTLEMTITTNSAPARVKQDELFITVVD